MQLAAGIAVVGGLGPRLLAGARTHPYFAVAEIELRHRGHVDARQVRAAAGLREGMSIWDVDVDAARHAIERLPWVRTARVTRRLPNRVTVRIREHRPAAIVLLGRERPALHYVATDGRVVAPVGPADGRDLPYVTGLDPARIETGAAVHELRAAMQALHLAARYRDVLGPVSEVHVDDAGAITVIPMRASVPIELGTGGFDAKLARVAAVLPRWQARGAEVRGVRATEDAQVIVRLRVVPKEWGT